MLSTEIDSGVGARLLFCSGCSTARLSPVFVGWDRALGSGLWAL